MMIRASKGIKGSYKGTWIVKGKEDFVREIVVREVG